MSGKKRGKNITKYWYVHKCKTIIICQFTTKNHHIYDDDTPHIIYIYHIYIIWFMKWSIRARIFIARITAPCRANYLSCRTRSVDQSRTTTKIIQPSSQGPNEECTFFGHQIESRMWRHVLRWDDDDKRRRAIYW